MRYLFIFVTHANCQKKSCAKNHKIKKNDLKFFKMI